MNNLDDANLTRDPWTHLRQFTDARIALGRSGSSMTTAELLRFRADHALARDAVHAELDAERLAEQLKPIGLPVVIVSSQAADRDTYLRRPELGRALDVNDRRRVSTLVDACDVSIVIGDGLSATATQLHAAATALRLVPTLRSAGLSVGPIVITRLARVAIQDDVGAALNAKLSLILLGERPGMGAPDSLGAYLVHGPRVGRTDAERNCVSNIRPAGLPPAAAAGTLAHLITQSQRLGLSGVGLKDERVGMGASTQPTRIE